MPYIDADRGRTKAGREQTAEVTDIHARRIAKLEREISDLREANQVLISVIEVFAATSVPAVDTPKGSPAPVRGVTYI